MVCILGSTRVVPMASPVGESNLEVLWRTLMWSIRDAMMSTSGRDGVHMRSTLGGPVRHIIG